MFSLSGASALIFEALWFHLAGLTFGNSVWAASIVLSSFMGGLALGNGMAAFRGDLIKSPLGFYVVLEFVIGISGLLIVILFPYLTLILTPLFKLLAQHTLALNSFRICSAIIILVIPSTAMGLTLPVLVRVLDQNHSNFGEILGALYGWNTLGATAGVLLCELVLVKWVGIQGAGFVAAGFNFLAGIIAILILAKTKPLSEESKAAEPFVIHSMVTFKTVRILLASFLTGFIFLALEVVWFRFILLFYNGVSWNFATILAAVLAGISLGGIFISMIYKIKSDIHAYITAVFLLVAVLVLYLYCNFDWVFSFTKTFHSEISIVAAASLFLVFPVAFASGIIFTMLGRILYSENNAAINITGLLTLANTAGGMVGALAGGYFLIPVLGVEKTFVVLSLFYVMAALFVAGIAVPSNAGRKISFHRIATCVAFVFLGLSLFFFPFGLMNRYYSYRPIALFVLSGEKRIVLKEGLTETIQYLQKEIAGTPYYQRLITNSHTMSSTISMARRYMNLFVYLPMAVHPDPKEALLICYGCGVTAKALTEVNSLENIEIVDLSKDIIEMSKYVFPDPQENPVNDPRVNIHIEDGRFFLLTTDRKYDLITAEPPPPKYKGIVSLYSQQYFQSIYNRLNQGGIVTYWLPVKLQTIEENKSILKGFCNVFQNCSLWTGAGYQWIMMGTKGPEQSPRQRLGFDQWADPAIKETLRSIGINHPDEITSLFIADSKRLQDWIGDTPPLTDNYPRRITTSFSLIGDKTDLHSYADFMDPAKALSNFVTSGQMEEIWPDILTSGVQKYFLERGVIDDIFLGRYPSYEVLHQCLSSPTLKSYIPWIFNSDHLAQKIISRSIAEEGIESVAFREDPGHLAAYHILKNDYLKADIFLQKMNRHNRIPQKDYYLLRMYLLYLGGDVNRAVTLGEAYINEKPDGREKRQVEIDKLWAVVKKPASSAGGSIH